MTGSICAQVPQRELQVCLLEKEVAGWGGIMYGKTILNSLLVLNVVLKIQLGGARQLFN